MVWFIWVATLAYKWIKKLFWQGKNEGDVEIEEDEESDDKEEDKENDDKKDEHKKKKEEKNLYENVWYLPSYVKNI